MGLTLSLFVKKHVLVEGLLTGQNRFDVEGMLQQLLPAGFIAFLAD